MARTCVRAILCLVNKRLAQQAQNACAQSHASILAPGSPAAVTCSLMKPHGKVRLSGDRGFSLPAARILSPQFSLKPIRGITLPPNDVCCSWVPAKMFCKQLPEIVLPQQDRFAIAGLEEKGRTVHLIAVHGSQHPCIIPAKELLHKMMAVSCAGRYGSGSKYMTTSGGITHRDPTLPIQCSNISGRDHLLPAFAAKVKCLRMFVGIYIQVFRYMHRISAF